MSVLNPKLHISDIYDVWVGRDVPNFIYQSIAGANVDDLKEWSNIDSFLMMLVEKYHFCAQVYHEGKIGNIIRVKIYYDNAFGSVCQLGEIRLRMKELTVL